MADDRALDAEVLEDRLAELEAARPWSPRVISRFETRIREGEDLELFRINPLAYARERGVDEAEAIDWANNILENGVNPPLWLVLGFDTVSPDNAQEVCNQFACPAAE